MRLRKAVLNDLEQMVSVHIAAFPGFFLTSLGRGFLKQYYKIYIKYSHIAIVAEENDIIYGFVVGTNNSSSFYKNLKHDALNFTFPILRNVLSLSLLSKIFKKSFSIFTKKKVNKHVKPYNDLNELTSIGVSPDGQNKGVGSKLLTMYEQYCITQNIKGITLTTDAENNSKVLKFYQKFGYVIDQTFVQDDRRTMYSLVKFFRE